jgi:peptidoglycan/xylan/chitin deacetylase (PgdA/CDA1 family)/2-polyprenyl-3-methyl-5-hydroxy-6-metoxy-1,4-benzoquinol methylase
MARLMQDKRGSNNDRRTEAEQQRWDRVFSKPDPWQYHSQYEVTKRHHVLEMLPECPIEEALEIGCAEGHLTELLHTRVSRLTALDISERALERAKVRCADASNITFVRSDIHEEVPNGPFDLIVCTEILYYMYDRHALAKFVSRAVERLSPGGHIVLEHPNMVSDDRTQTGFDFNEIGTDFIASVFSAHTELEFLLELKTPLYKAQQFRRSGGRVEKPWGSARGLPREVLLRDAHFLHPALHWGGCAVTRAEALHCWETVQMPILMYHRVADSGAEGLSEFRVDPSQFERQIAYLKRHGYTSTGLRTYDALRRKNPTAALAGRVIAITFDDAYEDFVTTAWPILRAHGFTATVFVPVGSIGGHAEWDSDHGQVSKLMNWEQLQSVAQDGVEIGSHGFSHTRLPILNEHEINKEVVASRDLLQSRLGIEVAGFSYPYTQRNQKIRQIVASAGYQYAVVGRRPASAAYNSYEIPRIEVLGSNTMDGFVEALPPPSSADDAKIARFLELRSVRDRRTYMR